MKLIEKTIIIEEACTEINKKIKKKTGLQNLGSYIIRYKDVESILKSVCPKYNLNVQFISKVLDLQ